MFVVPRQVLIRIVAIGISFILFISVASSVATPLYAQTRFQQPDTTADVAGYKYVEECISAVRRVSETVNARQSFLVDTFERSKGEDWREPIPSEAVAVARKCSAKFDPETVPLKLYDDWMRLYLMASRDDAAAIVEKRQLVETHQRDLPTYYQSAVTMFVVYAMARPIRWAKMLELTSLATEKGTTLNTLDVMNQIAFQLVACEVYGDTIAGRAFAEQLIAIANKLTPAERGSSWYQGAGLRNAVAGAYDYLSRHELLDSLRRSPEAYVALKRANFEKASGSDVLPGFLGKKAPTIVADFWFDPTNTNTTQTTSAVSVFPTPAGSNGPQTAAPIVKNVVRPTPGKFALVVFLDNGCRADAPKLQRYTRAVQHWRCWDAYAIMRRLSKQFPSLEITVVSQTTGYVGDTPVLTSQEEAQLLRSWWLGFHRLPAMLAVTNTPFFRLPAPDLRRIDNPTANAVNYTFGLGQQVRNAVAYLIDSNGTIIRVGPLMRTDEQYLKQMLSIITNRPK